MVLDDGVFCEIIDLCSILFWDVYIVVVFVMKIGCLFINYEVLFMGGFVSEIVVII